MAGRQLCNDERIALRDRLRAARYLALADAEGFQEICYAVESIGMRLHGAEASLHKYKDALSTLSKNSPLFDGLPSTYPASFTPFEALYETLRRARNDVMHTGCYARRATAAAVDLCIGLEDSLMNSGEAMDTVAARMVKSPVLIEPWQPVAHARQLILAHSFSYLPLIWEGQWKLLSDVALASYLISGPCRGDRRKALAQRVDDAVKQGLELCPAVLLKATDTISAVQSAKKLGHLSLIVDVENGNRLVGVLSPFELM